MSQIGKRFDFYLFVFEFLNLLLFLVAEFFNVCLINHAVLKLIYSHDYKSYSYSLDLYSYTQIAPKIHHTGLFDVCLFIQFLSLPTFTGIIFSLYVQVIKLRVTVWFF